MSRDEWFKKMNALCMTRTGCSWVDLCGDEEPWQDWQKDGASPEEFVDMWIQKYGLMEIGAY